MRKINSNKDSVRAAYKRSDIQKIVLGTIAVAGILAVAAVAPNAFQIIRLFKGNDRRYRSSYYLRGVLGKLEARGLVVQMPYEGQRAVRLTRKGEQELMRYQLQQKLLAKKNGKWDKKWRMVIFDIRESRKMVRHKIRNEIASLGFVRLQDSVWVFPYDCEEVIALLKAQIHTGSEILYIVADRIENDSWLKRKFGLT